MATIRRRGKKFQAIVRRGQHSQAKTFSSKSDAEHWSKKLELEFERSEAMLPNSAVLGLQYFGISSLNCSLNV